MNDKDIMELQERRLTDKVCASVEQTLKWRYSVLGLIVTALLSGGGYLLVDKALTDTTDSVTKTQALHTLISNRLANDLPKVETLSAQLSQAEQQLSQTEQQLSQAEQQIAQLGIDATSIIEKLALQLVNTTDTNLRYSQEFRKELANLSAIIGELVADQPNNVDVNLSEKIREVDKRLVESDKSIEASETAFAKNFYQMNEQINIQQQMVSRMPSLKILELSGWKIKVISWHGGGNEYRSNQGNVTVKVKILKDGELINESDSGEVLVKGIDGNNTDYSLENIGRIAIDITDAKEVVLKIIYTGSESEKENKFVFRAINDWLLDKNYLSFISDQTSNPNHFNASVHMQAKVKFQQPGRN
jgi:hypothetical protein